MIYFSKKILVISSVSVIMIAIFLFFPYSSHEVADAVQDNNVNSVLISRDFSSTDNLADMVKNSDLVVIGTYKGLERKWNMAYNPENPDIESSTEYVEGHLYNFNIEEILKGSSKKNININHRYSEIIKIEETSGDEVISDEGILLKEPSEITLHEIEVLDPLFIEPDLGLKYIVFLKKGDGEGTFYGAIEPFLIKFEGNNIALLQSNLIDSSDAYFKQTEVINNEKIEVINDVEASIDDNISDRSIDSLKKEIKSIDKYSGGN